MAVGDDTREGDSSPFSIRLLKQDGHGSDASGCDRQYLLSLLPAAYRIESDDLAAPSRNVTACLEKELDLHRLTSIHGWLWLVGRPMPPRPLHYQLLLGRDIVVTEQMDKHLVWTTGRIFLKPIPRFLLEPSFWDEYLPHRDGADCLDDKVDPKGSALGGLRPRALGFLFSYAALISHESDFRIATKKHLLPEGMTWFGWRTFVEQLNTEHIYPYIDQRFYYGELRLGRLNKIYGLSQTPFRGYMSSWNQYAVFFRDNFAWLAATTIYILVVLATMQLGLATERLSQNNVFKSASYGFVVFSILGPLAVAALIILAFCFMFINNWAVTVRYRKKRLYNISNRPQCR